MPETSRYQYVLVELHTNPNAPNLEWPVKELTAVMQSIMANSVSKVPVYEQSNNMYGLLVDLEQFVTTEARQESAYHSLHAAITKASGRLVTLYIGKVVDCLQEMNLSYRSANEATSYKYAENGAKSYLCQPGSRNSAVLF